jgi:hypothetical protein
MDTLLGLKAIINELDKALEQCDSGFGSVKASSRVIFSASSLIFALANFLQFSGTKLIEPYDIIVKLGLILLYFGLIVICVLINLPGIFHLPVATDWETLSEAFYGKSEEDILLMRISSTINVIKINDGTLAKYAFWTKVTGVLLLILVILMIATFFIPRLP